MSPKNDKVYIQLTTGFTCEGSVEAQDKFDMKTQILGAGAVAAYRHNGWSCWFVIRWIEKHWKAEIAGSTICIRVLNVSSVSSQVAYLDNACELLLQDSQHLESRC